MLRYLFFVATVSLSAFRLESPTFLDGANIPERFGCAGSNISPELIWTSPPVTTKTFALVITDTTVYSIHAQKLNIGKNITRIPEGSLNMTPLCPPPGERHSYEFTLYALDTNILNASDIKPHTLAIAKLTGYYQNPVRKKATKRVAFLSGA